jgi:hypothetical protein
MISRLSERCLWNDDYSRSALLSISVACALLFVMAGVQNLVAQAPFSLDVQPATASLNLGELDSIADAASDGRGHILLLDPPRALLIVTDTTLRVIASWPWRVDGVTRFWDPVEIGRVEKGTVAVLDRATHRITVLTISADGTSFKVERTLTIPLRNLEGMCPLSGGDFLVYGFDSGQRLHVVSGRTGAVIRSFGPADSTLHQKAQEITTQGRMACDQKRDEVMVSTWFLDRVEAFRMSSGRVAWSARLVPFRAIRLEDLGDRVSMTSGHNGYSRLSVAFYTGDFRVFQTTIASRRDSVRADTVVSYFFSRQNNAWARPEVHLPVVIPVDSELVLAVTTTPRRTAELYRIRSIP